MGKITMSPLHLNSKYTNLFFLKVVFIYKENKDLKEVKDLKLSYIMMVCW